MHDWLFIRKNSQSAYSRQSVTGEQASRSADRHFVCACSAGKQSNTSLAPFCSVERAVRFYRRAIDASETLSLENVKGSNIFTKNPIPECIYSFCCHFGWRDFSDQSVNKNGSNVQSRAVWYGLTADQEVSIRNQSSEVSVKELNFCFGYCRLITRKLSLCARSCLSPKF